MLTADEARSVYPLAWSLPADRSAEFISAVENALAARPECERGEGLAHRIARSLVSAYFVPPPMPHLPHEHVNCRIAGNPRLYMR
jgi:hypothetical protein